MKGKKLVVLGLATVMAVSTLIGCGDSKSGEGEKVELELFSTKTENADILQKMIDGFTEKNPNITITLTSEADAATVLKTRLTKDDIPEIVAMGGDSNFTELQGAGVLLDLSGEDFIANVQEAYLDMVYDVNANQEEKVYGIPLTYLTKEKE